MRAPNDTDPVEDVSGPGISPVSLSRAAKNRASKQAKPRDEINDELKTSEVEK